MNGTGPAGSGGTVSRSRWQGGSAPWLAGQWLSRGGTVAALPSQGCYASLKVFSPSELGVPGASGTWQRWLAQRAGEEPCPGVTLKLCPRGGPGPLISCCVPYVSPGFQHLVPGPAWPPCPTGWVQGHGQHCRGWGTVAWGPWSPLLEFAQLPLLPALGHVPVLFCEGMALSLSLVQAQPGHWNTAMDLSLAAGRHGMLCTTGAQGWSLSPLPARGGTGP